MCSLCHVGFCDTCASLPSMKNVCSTGGRHDFSDPSKVPHQPTEFEKGLSPRVEKESVGAEKSSLSCDRCGEGSASKSCQVCQNFYCNKCSELSALKNMCSNGSRHVFATAPTVQQPQASQSLARKVASVRDLKSDDGNGCRRCGVDGIHSAMCLLCGETYCDSCASLPPLRNSCASGAKHSFGPDSLPRKMKSERHLAVEEGERGCCGRCGNDGTGKRCQACRGFYCDTCSSLPPLRNPCSDGTRHTFPVAESTNSPAAPKPARTGVSPIVRRPKPPRPVALPPSSPLLPTIAPPRLALSDVGGNHGK